MLAMSFREFQDRFLTLVAAHSAPPHHHKIFVVIFFCLYNYVRLSFLTNIFFSNLFIPVFVPIQTLINPAAGIDIFTFHIRSAANASVHL